MSTTQPWKKGDRLFARRVTKSWVRGNTRHSEVEFFWGTVIKVGTKYAYIQLDAGEYSPVQRIDKTGTFVRYSSDQTADLFRTTAEAENFLVTKELESMARKALNFHCYDPVKFLSMGTHLAILRDHNILIPERVSLSQHKDPNP